MRVSTHGTGPKLSAKRAGKNRFPTSFRLSLSQQCQLQVRAKVQVGSASGCAPAVPEVEDVVLRNGTVDYYSVLQVDDDASEREIKSAYHQLAKVCHPDFAGEAGHNICILLNEAYETLMNNKARVIYDAQLEIALKDHADGYTGKELSFWGPERFPRNSKHTDPAETRAVFVDENRCIGCRNCTHVAPATFRLNPEFGRARVYGQWLNEEDDLETAILSCPVDCIHWVDRSELPALEHVCQKVQKMTGVSVMMTGGARGDVFSERDKFLKQRQQLEKDRKKAQSAVSPMQAAARRKAANDLSGNAWWKNFGDNLRDSFATAAAGSTRTATAPVSNVGNSRVGERKRRRASQPYAYTCSSEPIPPELALVPVCSETEN